jgi:hypothetical protein
VDICRTVAAAIFGDPAKEMFVPLYASGFDRDGRSTSPVGVPAAVTLPNIVMLATSVWCACTLQAALEIAVAQGSLAAELRGIVVAGAVLRTRSVGPARHSGEAWERDAMHHEMMPRVGVMVGCSIRGSI